MSGADEIIDMRNIRVKIAYVGTAYHGFQRQNNSMAVQNVIEGALSKLCNEPVVINGCSRTDAGVHANEYYFSFTTHSRIPCKNIVSGLNSFLPSDISAYQAEEMPEDFHARYSCKGKEYLYIIENSQAASPFLYARCWHYPYPLDIASMKDQAKCLCGTHDFSAFCGSAGIKDDNTRTVNYINIEKNDDIISIYIFGDGFLYNMVRIIVGTLAEHNGEDISVTERILQSRDRNTAGITAPAGGLYLNKVMY